ncbi:MAG TPA: acyl-CoA dehydrogenase [Archaeoglobus veneficus]|nr:acyl-CoA dehydrogenase [Archaeoglobus veneficus]
MMEIEELANEVSKKATKIDEENEMDLELLNLAFQKKLMGVNVPEAYNGLGKGYVELCMLAEELGKVSGGFAHSVVVHHMAVDALKMFGNEEQKENFLKRLTTKEVGTLAITEPKGGSDVAALELKAKKEGNTFILNGRKTLITNAVFGGIFITLAKTENGITAFIVEKEGLEIKKLNPSGMRGSGLASVSFKDVEVPKENILGNEGKGMKVALATLSPNRIPFAAMGLGFAERCLELAVKYAKQREAFGKKIFDFQGLQFMLADVATDIEAAKRLIYYSADVANKGDATVLGAKCKLFIAKVAKKAADVAVEVYGGHGILKGNPVDRAYRDAKILDIAEGTSEIMKFIIARQL